MVTDVFHQKGLCSLEVNSDNTALNGQVSNVFQMYIECILADVFHQKGLCSLEPDIMQGCINRSSFKTVLRKGFQGVAALFACILFSGKWCFDKLIFSARANFLRNTPEKLRVEKQ